MPGDLPPGPATLPDWRRENIDWYLGLVGPVLFPL